MNNYSKPPKPVLLESSSKGAGGLGGLVDVQGTSLTITILT